MKFAAACCALTLTCSAAFAPQPTGARAHSSALQADTATKTYSFTKSEEIFKEAKEVREE